MIKYIISFGVMGAIVAALTSANYGRLPSSIVVDWQVVKQPALAVQVEPPKIAPITRKITAPGVVEPVEEAKIASQILGKVIAVPVKEGDHVKAGDLLVKLDDADARSRFKSSQARSERLRSAIIQAEAELEKADRDEVRLSRLTGRGFATPTELADARSLVTKATASLSMSKQELAESEGIWQLSREELNRTEIRSPISGVVTHLDVAVGEVVIAGTVNLPGTVLMTVSDLSRMRVCAEVDESEVPLIVPGQRSWITTQFNNRTPIEATVDKITSKGKRTGDTVSFDTWVRVDYPEPVLRAGMTATVEIEVQRVENALGVPIHAVVHRRRKDLIDTPALQTGAAYDSRSPGDKERDSDANYVKFVFVLEGSDARIQPVETGISDDRRVEIRSGLTPDHRVIVGPIRALDELRDGIPVVVTSDSEGEHLDLHPDPR